MYAAELQNASIDATLSIDDSLKQLNVEDVILDPSRLLQVLINLLTNAISKSFDLIVTRYKDWKALCGVSSELDFGASMVQVHTDCIRIHQRSPKA